MEKEQKLLLGEELAKIAGAAEFIDRLGSGTWQADTTNLNTK